MSGRPGRASSVDAPSRPAPAPLVEAPGIEAEPERRDASSSVASNHARSAAEVTGRDVAQREETEKVDPVERALADALTTAAAAGRFDVVSKLADELAARRTLLR